jgi:hypothetical protein
MMSRAEIAACPDAYSLRELYARKYPRRTIAQREFFINKLMEARKWKK